MTTARNLIGIQIENALEHDPDFSRYIGCLSPWRFFGNAQNGVYLLVKGSRIVYIGSSGNIYQRISAHTSRGIEFDEVMWFPFVDGKHPSMLEKALIEKIEPVYNTNGSPVSCGTRGIETIGIGECIDYPKMDEPRIRNIIKVKHQMTMKRYVGRRSENAFTLVRVR